MKILAIDSSGLVASVALINETELIGEYTINYKITHSQTLLPMIDQMMKMLGIHVEEIDAIAISAGPGSFTGLRIGASTAKGLGLALKKPLISVPTVDAMAYNIYRSNCIICPLMDARRNQVYTGLYEYCGEEFSVIEEQMAVELSEVVDKLNVLGREVILLGDGVEAYKKTIEETLKVPYTIAPQHVLKQRAGALASLAFEYYKGRRTVSAMDFEPVYLRISQAERELLEKQSLQG